MNKRLRKKKHRGEFKEIGFDFKICFTPIYDDEKHFEMIDDIYLLIEQHGFSAGGGCDESSCDGHMAVLSWRINAGEMKNKLQSALLSLPGVTSVEFGENIDEWYVSIRELMAE